MDDLIDVIEGNRKYIKCLYVYNKIDVMGIDDVDRLTRQPHSVVISANLNVRTGQVLETQSKDLLVQWSAALIGHGRQPQCEGVQPSAVLSGFYPPPKVGGVSCSHCDPTHFALV